MMFAGFLLTLLLTGGDSVCNKTYRDLITHLNLNQNKDLFSMSRPTKNYTQPTEVHLDMQLYAVLDVIEKEQKFASYVMVDMWWMDDFLQWDPDNFCGMTEICLPTKLLWKPDLTVKEMTEKDKATMSTFLTVYSHGNVRLQNDMMLVTTCKMHVYKFPFDTQSCNLTFKSVVYKDDQIMLRAPGIYEKLHEILGTQSDWHVINITITVYHHGKYSTPKTEVVYTVTMTRRPVLYVVNFILPVFFFLCLDLASFLICERGGEKLSFKVTVMLAVTVMQLILHEILPSSSDRVPLIALYCAGIFGLMMLSLLETILAMYLMERDSALKDDETKDRDQSLSEDSGKNCCKVSFHHCFRDIKKRTKCPPACCSSSGETPSQQLRVTSEGSSCRLTEDSPDFEKEAMEALRLLLNSTEEKTKSGYWTIRIKTINRVFFVSYLITSSLFLVMLIYLWYADEDY